MNAIKFDWENPTFRFGYAYGKLCGCYCESGYHMESQQYANCINEIFVDEMSIKLTMELLSDLWEVYASEGNEIRHAHRGDDYFEYLVVDCYGAWIINDDGYCEKYEDYDEDNIIKCYRCGLEDHQTKDGVWENVLETRFGAQYCQSCMILVGCTPKDNNPDGETTTESEIDDEDDDLFASLRKDCGK